MHFHLYIAFIAYTNAAPIPDMASDILKKGVKMFQTSFNGKIHTNQLDNMLTYAEKNIQHSDLVKDLKFIVGNIKNTKREIQKITKQLEKLKKQKDKDNSEMITVLEQQLQIHKKDFIAGEQLLKETQDRALVVLQNKNKVPEINPEPVIKRIPTVEPVTVIEAADPTPLKQVTADMIENGNNQFRKNFDTMEIKEFKNRELSNLVKSAQETINDQQIVDDLVKSVDILRKVKTDHDRILAHIEELRKQEGNEPKIKKLELELEAYKNDFAYGKATLKETQSKALGALGKQSEAPDIKTTTVPTSEIVAENVTTAATKTLSPKSSTRITNQYKTLVTKSEQLFSTAMQGLDEYDSALLSELQEHKELAKVGLKWTTIGQQMKAASEEFEKAKIGTDDNLKAETVQKLQDVMIAFSQSQQELVKARGQLDKVIKAKGLMKVEKKLNLPVETERKVNDPKVENGVDYKKWATYFATFAGGVGVGVGGSQLVTGGGNSETTAA